MVDSNRWVIAMLLAFFLGHWGVHRFYMGYNTHGMVMLSLSLLGILTFCFGIGILILIGVGIWAFVEFIMICCNNLPMADGTPLR
jgi:TM2 domain-containing membrane protein YozV